jgi:hypothetical protein
MIITIILVAAELLRKMKKPKPSDPGIEMMPIGNLDASSLFLSKFHLEGYTATMVNSEIVVTGRSAIAHITFGASGIASVNVTSTYSFLKNDRISAVLLDYIQTLV